MKKIITIGKYIAAGLLIVILLVIIKQYAMSYRNTGMTMYGGGGPAVHQADSASDFGAVRNEYEATAKARMSVPASSPVPASAEANRSASNLLAVSQDPDLKYIRQYCLYMQADEPQDVFRQIRQITVDHDGLVVSSNITDQSHPSVFYILGDMHLLVPNNKAADVIDAITKLNAKVTTQTVSIEEVSSAQQDIQARIDGINAIKAQYEDILKNAKQLTDVLDLTDQIQGLEYSIQNLSADRSELNKLIDYVGIKVTLSNREILAPDNKWSFYKIYQQSSQSFIALMQYFAGIAIWFFVYVLPLFLIALIFFASAYGVLRLITKTSKVKS